MSAPNPTPAPEDQPVVETMTDTGEPSPAEVLRFDPFSVPVDDDGQPEIEEDAAPTAPAAAAPAAAAPAPVPARQAAQPAATTPAPAAATPTPVAAQAAPETSSELETLRASNRQLAEDLARLRAGQQPSPAAPAAPAAPAQPQPLGYAVRLPRELTELLRSDDPEKQAQALEALATGIAHITHQNVREEYRQFYSEQEKQIIQKIQTDAATRDYVTRVYSDFYGTYPQLNKPELRQLVQQTAAAVVKEAGGNPAWTPELRRKVAERVYGHFNLAPPAAPTEPTSAPAQPAPTPRRGNPPPRQRGVGVRPAAPAAPPAGSQEQHIEDVFNALR